MSYDSKQILTKASWRQIFLTQYPKVAVLPEDDCISNMLILALDDELTRLNSKSNVTTQAALDELIFKIDREVNRLNRAKIGQRPSSAAQGSATTDNDSQSQVVEDEDHSQPMVVEDDDETQAPREGVGYGSDGNVNVVYESEPM